MLFVGYGNLKENHMENKSLNRNLHKAKVAKNDEFYTQLSDIEKELGNYKKHNGELHCYHKVVCL